MSNGAFAFFAITLGTISVTLAALLVCMVIGKFWHSISFTPVEVYNVPFFRR